MESVTDGSATTLSEKLMGFAGGNLTATVNNSQYKLRTAFPITGDWTQYNTIIVTALALSYLANCNSLPGTDGLERG